MMAAKAGYVTGKVTDNKGNILPYASLAVKGTGKGTVAGSTGNFSIYLEPGNYVLVCQYVGFQTQEKNITVTSQNLVVDFSLSVQEFQMSEVIIRRGEDPAIEIMKQAIRRREHFNNQVDSFSVDVYVKGLMRSREIPEKFMGQKVDKSDMEKSGFDALGRGILLLSESQTKVSYVKPDRIKYQVLSSRQSGGGYGIGFPFFINFYTNNVTVFNNNLNPRGFISPVADNAFHYYKFHYEGNFFEGSKMIDRIKVTPRRKNEPLFEGYIMIVDEEWRIHSLELTTTKSYQLDLIDTLRITQIHSPVTPDIWRTQNQVVYLAANTFGFEWTGNFLNVYNNYDLDPGFNKKHFGRTVMSYDTAYNKRDSVYWNSIRPVPLEAEERRDFIFRDSLYKSIRDSISRKQDSSGGKSVKLKDVLIGGVNRYHSSESGSTHYRLSGLIPSLEYNTVEGLAIQGIQQFSVNPNKGRHNFELNATARYGWNNEHFNAFGSFYIRSKSNEYRNRFLMLSGGKRVSQFNHENPIDPLTNTAYTLFYKRNYMKIYENWFAAVAYNNRLENGIRFNVSASWEDRLPLVNTTDYSMGKKGRVFLPNHPYELASVPFYHHQALVTAAVISFQPGQRYIRLPDNTVPLESKYPTFELEYTKGIHGILGSDVDFDKWKFSVSDDLNLRMGGTFRYHLSVGGFLNAHMAGIPDYQHFN